MPDISAATSKFFCFNAVRLCENSSKPSNSINCFFVNWLPETVQLYIQRFSQISHLLTAFCPQECLSANLAVVFVTDFDEHTKLLGRLTCKFRQAA
jgi:hypothetical protein